MSTSVWSPL